jgi:photosystem I subunit III
MRIFLVRNFVIFFILATCVIPVNPTFAASTHLIPCQDSTAFQQRKSIAPEGYYYTRPFESYSSELLCGEDGLPHLPLDRLDRAVDVFIPIALFLYIAGFIGWSGRKYLQAANRAPKPEELEIFIDLKLAIASFSQGLLWPLLAIKELLNGELTAKADEISVSPR